MGQRSLTDEQKKQLAEHFDFLTIEASPEEAGEMLAYIRNEIGCEYAQHIQVPGQSRDLVTFGFTIDEYGLVAEISSEYERAMYDGILVTRQPHRKMMPVEIIEFMETGHVTVNDESTTEQIEGSTDDEDEDVDLDKDE